MSSKTCCFCYKFRGEVRSDFINCTCSYFGNRSTPAHQVCQEEFCQTCKTCFYSCDCIRCYGCHVEVKKYKELCKACDKCSTCCKCWTCTGCRTRISSESPCDLCSKCELCCKCLVCGDCGISSKTGQLSICSDCRHCLDCCGCEDRFFPSSVRVLHHPSLNFHPANPKDKISRYLGVEIEVASSENANGKDIFETLQKWGCAAVHDGSLPESGYEINTAPAKGNSFTKQINEICDVLDSANATVDRKCGLHVHIDCRDMRYYDLRKLLYVYCKIEQDLFSMISPRRTNNTYCEKLNGKFYEPLSRKMEHNAPKEWKRSLLQTYYGTNIGRGEFRKQKYNQNRYYALNVHSWFYRGTIEFRHHHGTVEATAILNWANICHTIVQYAMNNSETDIEKNVDKTAPLLSVLHDQPKLAEYFKDRKEFYLTR